MVRPLRDVVLPVSIFGEAHRVSPAFRDINHVPVADPEKLLTDEEVYQAILTTLLRSILSPSLAGTVVLPEADVKAALPRVFFCHCKADGDSLARKLRGYLYEHTQLSGFFDMHDIPHGQGVHETIRSAIAESCLLVVWTDNLLQSRWCQFEILEARSQQRPLLVLDALRVQAPRVFPFLSNMPVVRWSNNPGELMSRLLLELVRTNHISLLFQSLSTRVTPAPRFMLHPPDIMEANNVLRTHSTEPAAPGESSAIVVYPDPPLPAEELIFLGQAFPTLHLHSLSEWTALQAAGLLSTTESPAETHPCPLSGLSIGLSVSSAESWPRMGLIPEHQDDYIVDIARQLILLGARLLWGGDLRPEGLGGRLEQLVQQYHQADHAPQDHIASYLAWPNYRDVPPKEIEKRRKFADVECLPNPQPQGKPSYALDALAFSLMRRQLAAHSRARIVLGGRLSAYRGRYPGIVEEAWETLLAGGALYIVGGFGGASRAVYDAIVRPGSANDLEQAWNERCKDKTIADNNADYDALARSFNLDLRVDHPGLLQRLGEYGIDGLCRHNGLSEADNARLATSQDLPEIISLLVQGLVTIVTRTVTASHLRG
jgi:hypothetical protein